MVRVLSQNTLESLERDTALAEQNLSDVEGWLQARGISLDTAREFRLGFVSDKSSRYFGRLSIPSLGVDLDGVTRVRGIKYRQVLTDEEPKYLCTDGFEAKLFNPQALMRPGVQDIHVTEGELDCIILSSLGYAAVGVPGASYWKGENARRWSVMLEGYERVWVWGDNDKPGREFNKAVISSLVQAVAVDLSPYPEKADVNEVFLIGGHDLIKTLIGEEE